MKIAVLSISLGILGVSVMVKAIKNDTERSVDTCYGGIPLSLSLPLLLTYVHTSCTHRVERTLCLWTPVQNTPTLATDQWPCNRTINFFHSQSVICVFRVKHNTSTEVAPPHPPNPGTETAHNIFGGGGGGGGAAHNIACCHHLLYL